MKSEKKPEKTKDLQTGAVSKMAPVREGGELFGLQPLFQDVEQFFEEMIPRRWWHGPAWGRLGRPGRQLMQPFEGKMPNVDLVERDEEFLVKAELPGVEKENIDVTLSGSLVTIEAKVSHEEEKEEDEYYHREISRGSFKRSMELPAAVKEDGVRATFKNGLLTLKIPKAEKTQRHSVKVE